MWVGNLHGAGVEPPAGRPMDQAARGPLSIAVFPRSSCSCCIGAYSVDNKIFDVYALAALSAVGYVLLKLDCEPVTMVLGFILGPMMEENLRRAMMISFGDPTVVDQAADLRRLPVGRAGAARRNCAASVARQARRGDAGVVRMCG
jgi:putative tricarboxylic transport membrane protein